MESSKILLISADPRDRRDLSGALAADDGPRVETAPHAGEALKRLETSTADAVVCVVDSPEQVSCVVRMGKHRPEIPVLMLTSLEGEDVRELGLRMGAASVVTRSREPRQTAAVLREALRSRELSREPRQEVGRTRTLPLDVLHRQLLATAIGLSAGLQEAEFSLLLVEDDRDQAALFLASLKRAGLPPFARSFPSAEEALGYLKGEGRGPLPSLVISDLNLPGRSGLDLLRGLKGDPELRDMPFVLYTSSRNPADVEAAAALGAEICLIKTADDQALVDFVRTAYENARKVRAGET